MQLGNPSAATTDANNHTNYLIQRPIEALSYNDNKGLPNWASWDLTAGDANGAVARQDSFAADTNLPSGFYQVGPNEYSHSGYARGHLCPSADRTNSTNDNDMTFLMDNMMPQTTDNNSGTWNNFESYCRSQAAGTNNSEVLIICGPSGFTGAKVNTNGYVWIPQYTWKIAVIVPPGEGTATNRITATNRVIAIKVPNTNGVSSTWQNFITSVNQIQVDTGLIFFTALPPAVAAALRAKVDGQTNPPPSISTFSPAAGAAGTNVVITGTNFTGTTQVTFNGASANYTVDSSNQLTAVVPTKASSGSISVTTASGTTISTGGFTVFSTDGGTVYSGILAGWDVSTQTGFGVSPLPPTTRSPNLFVGDLTRGDGVLSNGGGLGSRGWGGTSFTNLTVATAIASNQFIMFSVTPNAGYTVSFTSINRLDYRRSSTGPTNGVMQYQVGSGVFNDITNLNYVNFNNNGSSIGPIDLSGFAALQHVGAGVNVSFRIVNYLGTSSLGTWYLYDVLGNAAPDLAVQGTVTQLIPPIVTPGFQAISFDDGQISLIITGAPTSYTISAATNLANPLWVNLLTTNPAVLPFNFVDTNRLTQRFYRVQNP